MNRIIGFVLLSLAAGCAAMPTESAPPDDAVAQQLRLEKELQQREAELNRLGADNAPDVCQSACQLKSNICELAKRICDLARQSTSEETASRCKSAEQSCAKASRKVESSCSCE